MHDSEGLKFDNLLNTLSIDYGGSVAAGDTFMLIW